MGEQFRTFRQQMGNRLETIEVSVVRLYPEVPSLYLPDSFVGKILQEAGLSRPSSQRGTGGQRPISHLPRQQGRQYSLETVS